MLVCAQKKAWLDEESQNSEHWEKLAQGDFLDYYSPTCTSTFRYIEGYMLKTIENGHAVTEKTYLLTK